MNSSYYNIYTVAITKMPYYIRILFQPHYIRCCVCVYVWNSVNTILFFYPIWFSKLGSSVIFCISLCLFPRQEGSIWNKETVLNETDTWRTSSWDATPHRRKQKAVKLTLYFRDPLLRLLLHDLLLEMDLCYLGQFLSLCGTEKQKHQQLYRRWKLKFSMVTHEWLE